MILQPNNNAVGSLNKRLATENQPYRQKDGCLFNEKRLPQHSNYLVHSYVCRQSPAMNVLYHDVAYCHY